MSETKLSVGKALQKIGRGTASAISKMTGRPIKSVLLSIHTLHTQSKIHVGAYERNNRGQVSKVWYWGDGDDKREPNIVKHKDNFIPRPDEAAAWLTHVQK
jgi:hypothetical protein